MPPPSTPAQPRFLLSKRQAPQSQSQKQPPTPQQGGPQQFAPTPRFNLSAATSAQATVSIQPPIFSTPAPPPSARQWSIQRGTQYDPLDDAIDTSPISSAVQEDEEHQSHFHPLDESIEIDSPSASRSYLEQENRPAKRRRVSISPEIDASPDDDEGDNDYMEVDDDEPTGDHLSVSAARRIHKDVIAGQSSSLSGDDASESNESESPSPAEPSTTRHPTFHKAPRFKATVLPEGAQRSLLPDAFSPQRRGPRYLPGGLAAELREWLVQVKGASEYDRPAGSSVEVTIDEAKAGNGMWVVAAHETDDAGRPQEEDLPKVILAGDGRTAGLGGRNTVRPGTTVSLHQPMWDVDLGDLGRFAVACDWEIS